ncbi:hypothetical protein QAD02_005954 [Eretmocerus hayati]|uniref:Uncharacterized protein n=1 Tax=Eretmocerus hayati TaxID=131215 RepID=A0ACC2MZU2_9HYME|nr:hypothetical protein QAD02_005954 [Eretmocerus hayati]
MLASLVLFALFNIITANPVVEITKSPSLNIIDGDLANIEDHPYVVSIEFLYGEICIGTIITDTVVLVTAACAQRIPTKDWQAVIRSGSSTLGENGTVHTIIGVAYHMDWDGYYNNNIGLIHIDERFIFDRTRQPIKLFEQGDNIPIGATGVVSGFDFGQHLVTLNVTVVDHNKCQLPQIQFNTTQEICTQVIDNSYGVECSGDEGAPLVVDGRLAGIMSRYSGYCSPRNPNVYLNIANYRIVPGNFLSLVKY